MRKPYLVADSTKLSYHKTSRSCIHCGQPATMEALFKDGSATVVERYCDSCLQTEKFTAVMTFYMMNEK